MPKQRKQRGVTASPIGRNRMTEAKAKKQLTNEDTNSPWNNERIAHEAKVNEKTVSRFFNGTSPVDLTSAHNIISVLELKFDDVVSSTQSLTSQVIDNLENEPDEKQAGQLIHGLEDSLTTYLEAEEVESIAVKWMESNYEKIININDIRNEIQKINIDLQVYEEINAEDISKDLKKYIEAVQYCLELGSLQLIDTAIEECLIPSTYNVDIYVHFLEFIRDFKILNQAPLNISSKILIPLNYMIKVLPIKL